MVGVTKMFFWNFLILLGATPIIIIITTIHASTSNEFARYKAVHQPQQLSNNDLEYLSALSDRTQFDKVLDAILIPRVVGTANHEKVFKFIKRELEQLKWTVDIDAFNATTPTFGLLTFKNIISTLDPHAERFLVLACHYDSKYYNNSVFVGAIDSAVPCAMMLNLARVMHVHLAGTQRAEGAAAAATSSSSSVSLKLIFFDGEEAFDLWGPTDSIYGARHLAERYHSTKTMSRVSGERVSELERIDVLVLLDLIGAKNPSFFSFFPSTDKWYLRLVDAEYNLARLDLFKDYNRARNYFQPARQHANIEDDHLPFLRRDVPILHLITVPFPPEWHTPRDNRKIVDLNTVDNINKILRVFVAEYLHLLVVNY